MDEIEKFINREYIAEYSDQFRTALDPTTREIARRLLLQEEHAYGLYSEQLPIAANHIEECDERIAEQRTLVRKMKLSGEDIRQATILLDNLLSLREEFVRFQRFIVEQMNEDDLASSGRGLRRRSV
jgi:hypothetical protein